MATQAKSLVFVSRLGYFEVRHRFMSAAQLRQEVMSHYMGMLMRQVHVLVLGLDVIGNPFGFVVDLTQGELSSTASARNASQLWCSDEDSSDVTS